MRVLLSLFVACALAVAAQAESAPAPAGGVLILGDSNAEGPFGGTLYNALRATRDPATGKPLAVSIFAKCGAGANDWVDRDAANIDCGAWTCAGEQSLRDCHHFRGGFIPPLRDLYAELGTPRRVTLVALGLNMIIGKRSTKLRDAERLIDAIHAEHSACIWIGPPEPGDLFVAPEKYESFVADLKQTVLANGCRYIASDDKTDRRDLGVHTKDDHYGKDDAIAWAGKVLDELHHPRTPNAKSLLDMLHDQPAMASAQ